MGTFGDPSGQVDLDLQTYILGKLADRSRGAVVSASAVVADIRAAFPEYRMTDARLASIVSEAAMLIGLVPDIVSDCKEGDSDWKEDGQKDGETSEDEPSFGYGYPAHRPDPSAVYVFRPGQPRTLPIRGNRHVRFTK